MEVIIEKWWLREGSWSASYDDSNNNIENYGEGSWSAPMMIVIIIMMIIILRWLVTLSK